MPRNAKERRGAARQLRAAKSTVQFIRFLAALNVLGLLVPLRDAVQALETDSGSLGLVLLHAGLIVFLTLAFFLAAFQPVLWMSGLAAVMSGYALLDLARGETLDLLRILWLVFLWLAVLPALRARRIAREHPDLAALMVLGTAATKSLRRLPEDERDEAAEELVVQARRKAIRNTAAGAALIAVLTAAAVITTAG